MSEIYNRIRWITFTTGCMNINSSLTAGDATATISCSSLSPTRKRRRKKEEQRGWQHFTPFEIVTYAHNSFGVFCYCSLYRTICLSVCPPCLLKYETQCPSHLLLFWRIKTAPVIGDGVQRVCVDDVLKINYNNEWKCHIPDIK